MSALHMLFIGRGYKEKLERIDRLDTLSAQIHQANLATIAVAQEKADTLKGVLEANGITIKISKATGHKKYDTRTRRTAI